MLTTNEMLNLVESKQGECLEIQKIINSNWVSTFFIFVTKRFNNGKVNFMVENDGKTQIWTNYEFLEFFGNENWRLVR